eukprot:3245273-Prymnesium_polylepis.1
MSPGAVSGRYARPAVPLARAPPPAIHATTLSSTCWPMAYDAPGGGIGRYAHPAVPWLARGMYVSMRGLLGSRRVPSA